MNRKHLNLPTVGLLAALALAACGGGGGGPTSVTVTGLDTFKFEPAALTGKVGQQMTVTLQNTGALEHSFVIDELSVKIGPVAAGGEATGQYTPQSAGTLTYYCDVPGHREAGMTGTLTVNP